MTIRTVRTAIARLPNATLKTSYGGNVAVRDHVFVAAGDDDGTVGYGEGSPLPHFSGERATEMVPIIRTVLAPAVIGTDPFDLERVEQAMARAIPNHHAAKAALSNAILDLAAKRARLPAHALLGGIVRDKVPLAGAVGIEPDETVVQSVAALIDKGVTTVKLKIGSDVERDIRIIRTLRHEFSETLEIRADANTGLEFAQAVRFLRAVEDCRLQYLEQPLRPTDFPGLARLRGLGTPIAVDESLFGLHDALTLAGAVDVFILKLIKLGGLYQARKVVAIAEAADISCVAVSPYESALGIAANVHLAASSYVCDKAAELDATISAVTLEGSTELTAENGMIAVPMEAGMGVDLLETLFDGAEKASVSTQAEHWTA